MVQTITYSVDISWSEIIDFLDEKYLELLCKRLGLTRDRLVDVSVMASTVKERALCLFNCVELREI